jgi:hypothetical protein
MKNWKTVARESWMAGRKRRAVERRLKAEGRKAERQARESKSFETFCCNALCLKKQEKFSSNYVDDNKGSCRSLLQFAEIVKLLKLNQLI